MNITKTASLFLLSLAVMPAQQMNPSCKDCSASYIGRDEIQAYLQRAPARAANAVSDQQIRAVDVGKSHVDVGVVYRDGAQAAGSAVAEHDLVSEVYYIIEGSATLVTGSDIVGWKARPADNQAVRLLNGPGGNGESIRNGVAHELKAGDSIIIPAGVGHLFTKVNGHIQYLMVRIDPDKVTPVKDENASKADLAGK
jgi:mannose-6-phosphate isomerase-like protein (cupin superfamily)